VAEALFPGRLVAAAVLVPLIVRDDDLHLLLTRRTDDLRDHPGQVSFPGGRVEARDATALATALRESEEELGIPPGAVEVLGFLPPHAVVTGFVITPVVCLIQGAVAWRPDPLEVAEAFEVPWSFLSDPANLHRSMRQMRNIEIPLLEFRYGSHRIWGATASIIETLINTF
jgi:8-oxo-dGTP pyrophosphatase MutT (NUDIX family)